ncbi:hypothetical protein PAEPH01_0477 [Pancytospora epiphaga]|nr:hypothetical protein PAEPH01_0477 [Pancytospora epiphaga]
MFNGLLDVEDKIDWAEKAPKHRNRKSQFLTRKTGKNHDLTKHKTASTSVLMLPAPTGQDKQSQPQRIAEVFSHPRKSSISRILGHATGAVRVSISRVTMCMDPVRIIGWIHIFLNAFILAAVLYVFSYLLYFVTVDVLYRIHLKKEEARALITEAKRLYIINRCDPTTRVPALETQCGEWDCVARNGLSGIKYTKIVVEVIADVLEGFVSRFSIRSYSVFASILVLYLIFRR